MICGFLTRSALAVTFYAAAVSATAAPVINVELYNFAATNNVAANQTYIGNNTPDQRFRLTSLPSILGDFRTDPVAIFGTALVEGSIDTVGTADTSFQNTLYRFAGFLDLGTTPQLFRINANDGFLLNIAGVEILRSNTQGTQVNTTIVAEGPQAFELIYWNNANQGNLNFTINGAGITPVDGPVIASTVPLPGSLSLVLAGFGCMVLLRRRRKTA